MAVGEIVPTTLRSGADCCWSAVIRHKHRRCSSDSGKLHRWMERPVTFEQSRRQQLQAYVWQCFRPSSQASLCLIDGTEDKHCTCFVRAVPYNRRGRPVRWLLWWLLWCCWWTDWLQAGSIYTLVPENTEGPLWLLGPLGCSVANPSPGVLRDLLSFRFP